MQNWSKLERTITDCQLCPRLVEYRAAVAKARKREFKDWEYWGKPVAGFGDPKARVWIVGLAPAAHGANRTGRMFTGDSSGNWLYRVLHENGFANQPTSTDRADGLMLKDVFISAAARCAPPDNKPTPAELAACERYLRTEAVLLDQVKIVVPLGKIAWDSLHRAFGRTSTISAEQRAKKPDFKHGAKTVLGNWKVRMSYHPSRQNTNTGRLTWPMWNAVFESVRTELEESFH